MKEILTSKRVVIKPVTPFDLWGCAWLIIIDRRKPAVMRASVGTNPPGFSLNRTDGQLMSEAAYVWDPPGPNREFLLCNCPFCKLFPVTFCQIPVMYSDELSRICGKRRMPCLSSSNGSSPPSSPGLHGLLRDTPSNTSARTKRLTSVSVKRNNGHRAVTVTPAEGGVTVTVFMKQGGGTRNVAYGSLFEPGLGGNLKGRVLHKGNPQI